MQYMAFLHAIITAAAVAVSIWCARPERTDRTEFAHDDPSATEVALLASGVTRAVDAAVVSLLQREIFRIERVAGRRRRHVIVAGPAYANPENEGIADLEPDGTLTRGDLLRILRPGMLRERDGLVARGLVRSGREAVMTVVRRSYPIVLSSGLGVFLLALHPGFWPDRAIGGCLAIGLAVLLLVNTRVRLTGSGEAALLAIRRHHADRTWDGPHRVTYDVALWGLERLEATPHERYLTMKIEEAGPST